MTTPLLSDHDSRSNRWEANESGHTEARSRPSRAKPAGRSWLVFTLVGLAVLLAILGIGSLVYLLLQPPAVQEAPKPQPVAEVKRKEIVKNVFLETQGDVRRVVVLTTVVHREGQLEGLLTKARTKEHEYILAFDGDAIHIHTALLAAGAEAGSPVKFEPKYTPATGSTIKTTVRYEKAGRMLSFPAREWVQNVNTKKHLDQDWVFGGSHLLPDPDNPQRKIYVANYGDLICVCNMDTAMLDLPVRSPKRFDDRLYQAFTERIPPEGTKVELILEPIPAKKEK